MKLLNRLAHTLKAYFAADPFEGATIACAQNDDEPCVTRNTCSVTKTDGQRYEQYFGRLAGWKMNSAAHGATVDPATHTRLDQITSQSPLVQAWTKAAGASVCLCETVGVQNLTGKCMKSAFANAGNDKAEPRKEKAFILYTQAPVHHIDTWVAAGSPNCP